MKRREFITLVGGAATVSPLARAQQGERMRRIGIVLPAAADDPEYQGWVGAFLQALALFQRADRHPKARRQRRPNHVGGTAFKVNEVFCDRINRDAMANHASAVRRRRTMTPMATRCPWIE